jgi:hypothetical protein
MTDFASQGHTVADPHLRRDFAEGQEHEPADQA